MNNELHVIFKHRMQLQLYWIDAGESAMASAAKMACLH